MNIFRNFKLLLSVSMTVLSLTAHIPPTAFHNVFACFNPEFKMCAPSLGCAILQTGLADALRFCVVKPGKKDLHGNRLWIKDQAPSYDPVAALTQVLFPSPTGVISPMTNHKENIGRSLTVEHIAQLLNFCAYIREMIPFMGGNHFGHNVDRCITRLIAAENKHHNTTALEKPPYFKNFFQQPAQDKSSATLKYFLRFNAQGRILLTSLCRIIEAEERNVSGWLYPKFQAEQLLNAFFCSKFSSSEIPTLLYNLDERIIDHSKISEIREIQKNDLDILIKKEVNSLTLDDFWVIQNAKHVDMITPYDSSNHLISYALSCPYNRSLDQINTSITFSDCGEQVLRHLCNIILYSNELKTFDLSYLKEHNKHRSSLRNIENFYELQIPTYANSGEMKFCRSWNKVVGDLSTDSLVRYNKVLTTKGSSCRYEIDSGVINMVRALAAIFELQLDPIPKNNVEQWVNDSLKKAFHHASPLKNIVVKTYNLSLKSFATHDFEGKIAITVDDRFKIIISHSSKHAEVAEYKLLVLKKAGLAPELSKTCAQKFASQCSNTVGESLFLINEWSQEFASNSFYKIFNKNIHSPSNIVTILTELFEQANENKIKSQDIELILKNCFYFFWDDNNEQLIKVMQNIIKKWKNFSIEHNLRNIIQVLREDVKIVNHSLFEADFNQNTDALLDFFYRAKKIYFEKNNSTKKVIINKSHPELENIDANFSDIEELKIDCDLEKLKNISLSSTSKLSNISLMGNFLSLEKIFFFDAGINQASLVGNFPSLKTLNLSLLLSLENFHFQGAFNSLEDIYLLTPCTARITIQGRCPQLRKTNNAITIIESDDDER